MADALPSPAQVVAFWREAGPQAWFAAEPAFDAAIRARFLDLHLHAAPGALSAWAADAQGALALVIVLDQFPRNLFRDSAHAFATDGLARAAAEGALAAGLDLEVEPALRPFLYMPLEHAEDPASQARAVALFEALVAAEGEAFAENLAFARLHSDVIARFGRFPHRNPVLGRETTAQERAFLEAGGFAG